MNGCSSVHLFQPPVLTVFGTGDAYIAESTSKASAEFVEDMEEVYLPGVCHWSMMDDPVGVNGAIEGYLKRRGF